MSIELTIRSSLPPARDSLRQATGLLVSLVLGDEAQRDARIFDDSKDIYFLEWSPYSIQIIEIPPVDPSDHWEICTNAYERTSGSMLLMLLAATAAAVLTNGQIIDDVQLFGCRKPSTFALLKRIVAARGSDAGEIVASLRVPGRLSSDDY